MSSANPGPNETAGPLNNKSPDGNGLSHQTSTLLPTQDSQNGPEAVALDWQEVIQLQAFSDRKAWIEEKTKLLEKMPSIEVFAGLDAVRSRAEVIPGLPSREELQRWLEEHDRIEKETEIFDSGELKKLREVTKAASKRNLSREDTDLIEITLTTIYALDKLLHLLRDRTENLDLLGVRLTWEEKRRTAWTDYQKLMTDLREFLENRARWSPSIYDQMNTAKPEPKLEPKLDDHPMTRRNSVVSIASVGSDTSLTNPSSFSRSARFQQAEVLSRDTAQFAGRVAALRHGKISPAGKALDKLIDNSRKAVPEEFLDEQEKLETKGINELENVGKFLMTVVMQWKKADEIYVETLKDQSAAQTLADEIEAAQCHHPSARQAAVFATRAEALAKRLQLRGNPTTLAKTFPRPMHPLFRDQHSSNDALVKSLSCEVENAMDLVREVATASKEYSASAEAVKQADGLCKGATDLLGSFANLMDRLKNGVPTKDGDGSPPDLTTESCLEATKHGVFLALLPSLLDEQDQLDKKAEDTLRRLRASLLSLDRPGVDPEFKDQIESTIEQLACCSQGAREVRGRIAARVNRLREVRRVWALLTEGAQDLEDLWHEVANAMEKQKWKPQAGRDDAPLTPESPAVELHYLTLQDANRRLLDIRGSLSQGVPSTLSVLSTSLEPQMYDWLMQSSTTVTTLQEDVNRMVGIWDSVRRQSDAMNSLRDEVHVIQMRMEDVKAQFDFAIKDVLSDKCPNSADVEVDHGNQINTLRQVVQDLVDGLSSRIPFISTNANIPPSSPRSVFHKRRFSSAGDLRPDVLQRGFAVELPFDPAALDGAVRTDCNSFTMRLSGEIKALEQKAAHFRIARLAKDLDSAMSSINNDIGLAIEESVAVKVSFEDAKSSAVLTEHLGVLTSNVDELAQGRRSRISRSLSLIRESLRKMDASHDGNDSSIHDEIIVVRVREVDAIEARLTAWNEDLVVLRHRILEAARVEAQLREQARLAEEVRLQAERDRLAAEELARIEKEKKEAEERERLERERLEAEENARLERLRVEEARARAEEERRVAEEKARLERERLEVEEREAREKARLEAEERARLEQQRVEAEERARLESERLEAEERARLERERIEAEEKARLERERLEAEERARLERERIEAEEQARLGVERLEAEERARLERERIEAEEKARLERERLEAKERARLERERIEAEEKAHLERERLKAEEDARLERERLEAEEKARLERERLQAEEDARLERQRLEAEEKERERLEREHIEAEERARLERERWKMEEDARLERLRLRAEEDARVERERLEAEENERARLEKARIEAEEESRLESARIEAENQARIAGQQAEKAKQEEDLLRLRAEEMRRGATTPPMVGSVINEGDVFGAGVYGSIRSPPTSPQTVRLRTLIHSLRRRLRSLSLDRIARPSGSSNTSLPSDEQRKAIAASFGAIEAEFDQLPTSSDSLSADAELRSLKAEVEAAHSSMERVHHLADLFLAVHHCDNCLSDLLEHIDSYPAPPAGPLLSSHVSQVSLPPEDQLSSRLAFTQRTISDMSAVFETVSDDPRAAAEQNRLRQTWSELEDMSMDRINGKKSRPGSVISSGRSSRSSLSGSQERPIRPSSLSHRKTESYSNLSVGSSSRGRFLAPPAPASRRWVSGSSEQPRRSSSRMSVASTARSVSSSHVSSSSNLFNSTFASRQRAISSSTTTSPISTAPATPSRVRAQTGQNFRSGSPALSEVSSHRSSASISTWSRAPRQSFGTLPRASTPRSRLPERMKKPYVPNPRNKLDVAVGDVVNNLPVNINIEVVADTWQDQSGKYWIGDQEPKLCFCRILRSQTVMVRVGGGWMELSKFIKNHFADLFRLLPDSPPRTTSLREEKWISSRTLLEATAESPPMPPRTPEPRDPFIPTFALSSPSGRSPHSIRSNTSSSGSPLTPLQFMRRADLETPPLLGRSVTPTKSSSSVSRIRKAVPSTPMRNPVWRP